ncbi:MAG: rhomboid family intramembrane serine protease [Bacteroidota bacterium]
MLRSILFPLLVVAVMWVVHLVETWLKADFSSFGLQPHTLRGLIGIVSAPFIHADFQHLTANTVPMFVSLSLVFYFYPEIAYRVFFLVWLFTGVWVWSFAQGASFHIGASGLVYGFVTFLLASGLIRRNARLMAISMLIVFLYGGFFWGIFPNFFPHRNISWESHLMGGLAGLVLAIYYRKRGIQREVYHWDDDDDADDTNMDYLLDDDESEQKQPVGEETNGLN